MTAKNHLGPVGWSQPKRRTKKGRRMPDDSKNKTKTDDQKKGLTKESLPEKSKTPGGEKI